MAPAVASRRYTGVVLERLTKATPFAVLAALELWLGERAGGAWSFPLTWAGLSTTWVALAYLSGRPALLGKRLHLLPLLAPVVLFAAAVSRIGARLGITERTEVAPRLWVGGWPKRRTENEAQLDCTAELPRRGQAAQYACVPMLDGLAVPGDALRAAVGLVRGWRGAGMQTLVHCAYGHGRSVAVACAVLVLDGDAASVDEALRVIQRMRPGARLDRHQRASVERCVLDLRSDR